MRIYIVNIEFKKTNNELTKLTHLIIAVIITNNRYYKD